jgi:DNA-binding CsgD family transcriptional regulator
LREGSTDEDQAAYESIAKFPPANLIPEYRVYGVAHDLDMPLNHFRDAVLRAGNSKSRSVARLNEIGPWLDIVGLHMPCYGSDIPPETFTMLEFLLPVIRKALESSRLLRNLTGQYGMLLDAFDALDFPAAFCGLTGELLLANRHMRDVLNDRDSLGLSRSGILEAMNPSDRLALRTALSAASQPRTKPSELWLQLGRRSECRPYVAKLSPIRMRDISKGNREVVLLLLADPEDDRRIHAEGLAAFGLLSPAELDVCRMLLRGIETEEIAERRSTSVETTRSQIKSATAKMACGSRLDLLRVALATSLPRLRKDDALH